MKYFEDLANDVTSKDGLLICTMEDLREGYEAGRLGPNVVKGIADKLHEHGLSYFPPGDLPMSQHETVRIYRQGSTIADVVNAILHPTEKGDRTLREICSGTDRDVLQRVKELVCD